MTNRRCHVKNVHTYYVPHVKFINSSHIVIWSQDFDNEVEFVTGDEWKAGNLSYHLKSRPKWEGHTNDDILNNSSEFICIDDVCLGRY